MYTIQWKSSCANWYLAVVWLHKVGELITSDVPTTVCYRINAAKCIKRAAGKCHSDASAQQQPWVVKSSLLHLYSFAPVVLISLQRDLRPLVDRTWLIRPSLYSGASEILLSAAMIYDTISRGGLDWLPSLPPVCQGCGRKVLLLPSNQPLRAHSLPATVLSYNPSLA